MDVLPTGAVRAPAAGRSVPRQGAAGFAVPDETEAASETAAAAPVSGLSLLSLQEVESDADRNRRARRHGEDMLDALRRLQRALLGETIEAEVIGRLDRLSLSVPLAADPALRALVDQVALRARVELALRAR